MKFDTFLATVNDWGRFQKVKYTLICLTYMLPPMMVYTYTFTAAKPDFRCANPSEFQTDVYSPLTNEKFDTIYKPTAEQCKSQQKTIGVSECQRCFIRSEAKTNQSSNNDRLEKCHKYVYDQTYHISTLVNEWDMVCDRVTWRSGAQMIFFIGYMVGSVFFGMLADKYGRRPVMSVSFILMSAAGFYCAFGPQAKFGFTISYINFVIARFLLACATRGISVSGFVLGSEIVGPSKRLLTGIVIEYFFAFGQYFLLLFAYFIRTWRSLTWAISLFTVPFMLFYFILPESPRWLVSRGRFDEAEKVLRRIADENKRTFDREAFQQVKEEQEKHMKTQTHQSGVMTLFQTRIMMMISLNLFMQWLVQNLVFYGVSQNTGSWPLDPYTSFAVSATVELLGYIIVHLILDRVGRKIPYCSFAIIFGVGALLILPVQNYMTKDSTAQKILINLINGLLKFCVSASYAIIYIYANELFPTNVRNTGMGMCSMVARIGAIIGTYCNDSLARIFIHLPILLYGSVSLVAAVFALMLPETLNRPLPQTIDDVERMTKKNIRIDAVEYTLENGGGKVESLLPTSNEDNQLVEELKRNDFNGDQVEFKQ